MPWWGWLLLGAGLAALVALGLWLLLRRFGSRRDVDRAALAESESTRIRANFEAEREKRVEAERVARELETELREVASRRKAELDEADENARARARELANDPDALLERLDSILGRSFGGGGN